MESSKITLVEKIIKSESTNKPLNVWIADPLTNVLDGTVPEGACSGSLLRIIAVRGETANAQLVLDVQSPLRDVFVEAATLSTSDGSELAVSANIVGYVPVSRNTRETPAEELVAPAPCMLPDPLLPMKPTTFEGPAQMPVWLSIVVPVNAEPGAYTGVVKITASGVSKALDIELEVLPITIPAHGKLRLTNWLNHESLAKHHGVELWSEPFWELLAAHFRCMVEHRQNVLLTPIQDLMKIYEPDDDSDCVSDKAVSDDEIDRHFEFDFALFDRWVDTAFEAGIEAIEGSHLICRAASVHPKVGMLYLPQQTIYAADRTTIKHRTFAIPVTWPQTERFLRRMLEALGKHLAEKGLGDKYYQHIHDEPFPEEVRDYRTVVNLVREYIPEVRIMDAVCTIELAGYVDVWVPGILGILLYPEFFEERRAAGDELWYYSCLAPVGRHANRFIDYPLIKTRIMQWVNFRFGLTGFLHWGYNQWNVPDPYTNVEPSHICASGFLPAGDSWIVYPGENGPVSSLRFEMMRKSAEDYELLKLLEVRDPDTAMKICASLVQDNENFERDTVKFNAVRGQLLEALANH